MGKKLPYLPLYTGDWKKDTALSMCSPATRGIWIDLLCAMHDDDRCGQVSGTPEELASLARCTAAQLTAAVNELKAKKAAHVTLRHKKVTVTNRKMLREHKERVGARLRQRRKRSHENVTVPSSMSLSISMSTDDRHGDQMGRLSEDDLEAIRHRANAVVKAIGKQATADGDRSLVLKAAMLSMRAPFSEQWLYSAAEGVARTKCRKKTHYGYLHKCLADGAAKLGRKLNTELAKTTIPRELCGPVRSTQPMERLCDGGIEL